MIQCQAMDSSANQHQAMIQCQMMDGSIKDECDVINDLMEQDSPFGLGPLFQQHSGAGGDSAGLVSLELSPSGCSVQTGLGGQFGTYGGNGMTLAHSLAHTLANSVMGSSVMGSSVMGSSLTTSMMMNSGGMASSLMGELGDMGGAGGVEQVRVSAGKCKVCGDEATGMYFGALVCVPCKTFFLRYAGDQFSFACKSNRDCEITVSSRTQCKYCRFQKCRAAGMIRKVRPDQVKLSDGQQLCVVCQDVANGIHFGAITCEGCKKFFRRGLKESHLYSCKTGETCVINPRTRNACRYCRYRTCLRVGMSREAIQMGRPSKVSSSDCSSISSMQQQQSSQLKAAAAVAAARVLSTNSHIPPSDASPPSHPDFDSLRHKHTSPRDSFHIADPSTAVSKSIVWSQDAFVGLKHGYTDAGFRADHFEPSHKRMHTSEGYQSAQSQTDSQYSPSAGSVSATERSGSSDSSRSILSTSSPEVINGLGRAWVGGDGERIGLAAGYDIGGHLAALRHKGEARHLQTIREHFNRPSPPVTKLADLLPAGVRCSNNGNIPHINTSTISSGGQITYQQANTSERLNRVGAQFDQFDARGGGVGRNASDVIDDLLLGKSGGDESSAGLVQPFDFDKVYSALAAKATNSLGASSNNNLYMSNDNDGLQGSSDFFPRTAIAGTTLSDQLSGLSAYQTSTNYLNSDNSAGRVSVVKKFRSQNLYQFSSTNDNAFSSCQTSEASDVGQQMGSQFGASLNNISPDVSGVGANYGQGTDGDLFADGWLVDTSSTLIKSELLPAAAAASKAFDRTSASHPSEAETIIDATESWITSIGSTMGSGFETQSPPVVSAEDDFVLDSGITLREQIEESSRYWRNISLPGDDEEVGMNNWEVMQRFVTPYTNFVQASTDVNKRLKRDFDNWLSKCAPEERSPQLSTWIQNKCVPVYTMSSVTYFKHLPGFTSFAAKDQKILITLGQSPSRILVAALSWFNQEDRKFNNFLPWRDFKYGATKDPFKEKLIDYAEKIAHLRIDPVEAALLNNLIIFATDYPGLTRSDLIEQYQRVILKTFRDYTNGRSDCEAPDRRLEMLFQYMPELRLLGLLHYKMTLHPKLGTV